MGLAHHCLQLIFTVTSFLKFVNTQKWWAASQSGNTRTWPEWQELKLRGHVPKTSGSPGALREPLNLGGIGGATEMRAI